MSTYLEADIPVLQPRADRTAADDRAVIAAARAASPIARGLFGPLVLPPRRGVGPCARPSIARAGHGPRSASRASRKGAEPGVDRSRSLCCSWRATITIGLRRLVSKAFTPKAVEALRPFTRGVVARLVD